MNAPVLIVHHLTAAVRRRGAERVVVADVSLRLDAGRSLAIVGESGAGKSMLVRSILGVHPPGVDMRVTGSVALNGHDLLTLRGRAKRRVLSQSVGMIHQDPLRSLNPTYRVGEQLTETLAFSGAGDRRVRRAKAVAAMEEIGFHAPAEEARRYPHELSGGQRQRIGIGAATLTEPSLLIGDEPTTALDVTVQRRVLDLMDERRARTGSALLLVTHDLGVAAERCDDIMVMRAGRVVEAGPARQLVAAPEHPYTQALIGAIPRLDGPRRTRLATTEGPLS